MCDTLGLHIMNMRFWDDSGNEGGNWTYETCTLPLRSSELFLMSRVAGEYVPVRICQTGHVHRTDALNLSEVTRGLWNTDETSFVIYKASIRYRPVSAERHCKE